MKIKLSEKQMQWLDAVGGRNISHVNKDEDGRLFIFLNTAGGGISKYQIPNSDEVVIPIDTLLKI